MTGPRNGQVDGWPNRSGWQKYVASWPAWRDLEVCQGKCPVADVCGRAHVCIRDERAHPRVVLALARLWARLGAQPPAVPEDSLSIYMEEHHS